MGNNFLKPLKIKIDCGESRVSATAVEQCEILNDYPELLKEEVGTYRGEPHHIRMFEQAKATTCQLRNIPIAQKKAVIKEIQAMDNMGIWKPVDTSEWVHPLVTVMKPDGGVRITTDLTRLNQYVIPDRFPLPRIKDIILSIGGSKIFSKLDLKKGYFHILLDDESRPLTTT
ncbi:MAG: RNA-directed DNA polymerase, partial [Gammaproteobacteria bacterium]|nr:RNA-directed DNA polymerase [Gammaproteobacteria bacterium]